MKQLITSLLVSLVSLYLIVAFISLKPDVTEWGIGGRAAYLFFGLMFGWVYYLVDSNNDKQLRIN
jgi:hypothetical protein